MSHGFWKEVDISVPMSFMTCNVPLGEARKKLVEN